MADSVPRKTGPEVLLTAEDGLRTRMGAWFPGERVVFRGADLHADLADAQWLELFYFGVNNRRFSEHEMKIINALWVFTSFPDPRLWNNRVAALAGSVRSTGSLAVSAALAVSEATIYGRKADLRAMSFIKRISQLVERGADPKELVVQELGERRVLPGFGRPITRLDERVRHMKSLISDWGIDRGRHIKLALEIERILEEGRWRLRLNYGGIAAALCADIGFDTRLYCLSATPVFMAGMLPCYIDTLHKDAGSFFPLRCSRVVYEGKSRRSWRA